MSRRWSIHVAALAAYALVAIVFSAPLIGHLSTHLTGSPDGDAGVYVWNQWVFRHELVEEQSNPYFTGRIFSLTRRADLSLHNYTTFANVLALPLMPVLGVIGTFNVVYLMMVVLTAYAMFLLARAVTGGANVESWLAGVLFAWAPTLVTRSLGHFSLASAAPLPVFLLLLLRLHDRQRLRDAVALGAAASLAAFTDLYYAVFCAMIAVGYVSMQVVEVHRVGDRMSFARLRRAIDVLIVCVLALAATIAVTGGWRVTLAGQAISMRGLYTPMLVAAILIGLRVGWRYRARVAPIPRAQIWRVVRFAAASGLVMVALLSPVLYGLGSRAQEGRLDGGDVFWRSSPPGVDLVSLMIPNPNHPFAPESWRRWLTPRQLDSYMESVASLPWIALLAIAVACYRGWRPPRFWLALMAAFTVLALGPFIHVAGLNTHLPGPWALLRYVPIIGLARSPARFLTVALIALAVMFAMSVVFALRNHPRRRGWLAAIALVLFAELLPAPRLLYSAALPVAYAPIAADPRQDVRVMELPLGVRDGRSHVGDYTARTQFLQTYHHKPVIGGLLSRVSRRRIEELREQPVVDALLDLSAGRPLTEELRRQLLDGGSSFVRMASLGYVVIDRARASEELAKVTVAALDLERIASDDRFDVYVPR